MHARECKHPERKGLGYKITKCAHSGPILDYSWDGQENFPSENAILELDLKSPYPTLDKM